MSRHVADRASVELGDLILPDYLSHPDNVPVTPSAWDDEFENASNPGGWVLDGGAGFDINRTAQSCLYAQSTSTIRRPGVPPFPFTVTAKCAAVNYDNVVTTAANASLGVGEATLGKFMALEWDIDTLNAIGPFVGKWTSIGATPSHFSASIIFTAGFALQVPHYQRLVVASTSDVTVQWSFDGRLWITIAANVDPAFTISSIVLLSYACRTMWDWVRITRP